jgi:geranylgeranyl diphosphate synthase type I
MDLYNEATRTTNEDDISLVLDLKTALYTFWHPLRFGMTMALDSRNDPSIKAIEGYCMHAGRLFQIIDDVLGVFGNEKELGKSPMDDIKQGKQTLLSRYTQQYASADDAAFFVSCLGNQDLSEQAFARCQSIVETSGAKAYALQQAESEARKAKQALQKAAQTYPWKQESVEFLEALVDALVTRRA